MTDSERFGVPEGAMEGVMEGGQRTGRPGPELVSLMGTFGSKAKRVLAADDFNLPPT